MYGRTQISILPIVCSRILMIAVASRQHSGMNEAAFEIAQSRSSRTARGAESISNPTRTRGFVNHIDTKSYDLPC